MHCVHVDHRGQFVRDSWIQLRTSGLSGRAFTHQANSLTCKIFFCFDFEKGSYYVYLAGLKLISETLNSQRSTLLLPLKS